MARSSTWHRGLQEGADSFTSANYHAMPWGDYEDGSTITRMRFRYQCTHVADIGPAEASTLGVAIGIALLDEFEDPAQHLFPYENPADPVWIWWEAPLFQPTFVTYTDGTNAELDLAPLYDTYRDSHAQRKVVGTQTLWLVSETSPISHVQTDHYLSSSYSVLVLDPA